MFKNLILAGVVTLSISGIAYAQSADVTTPVTGSSVYDACSRKLASVTGIKPLDESNAVGLDNYCAGFVLGVIQSDPAIKLPKGVTLNDAKEVIVSYLAQHPELRYRPAAKLIEDVLVAAYPRKE